MSWATAMMTQTAVYWGPGTPDGYGGWTFDSIYPVEVLCRWQEGEGLRVSADGEALPPSTTVLLAPTYTIEAGGWLFLGTLADLSSAQEGNPETVTGAHRVRSVNRRFNIPNEVVMYSAVL